jgi:NAD(P)-dependent dehydrogenase (short-subunit alcohol dehydrogenase family)
MSLASRAPTTQRRSACSKVSRSCIPIACDLSDLDSVSAAADAIRTLGVSLDAIVANAGVANLPTLQTRYGVEMQFLVNHIGHFALVGALCDLVRDKTGRIVIVTSNASVTQAPAEGIRFDNLDGHLFYRPLSFYGQSKFAAALYAKELSRRLYNRGIAVNSVHPGATERHQPESPSAKPLSWLHGIAKFFMRNTQRGAATQALLAASPRVTGVTGEYWTDCAVAAGNPLLDDIGLARKLWEVSEQLVASIRGSNCIRCKPPRKISPSAAAKANLETAPTRRPPSHRETCPDPVWCE